ETLKPERSLSHTPLFQTVFMLQSETAGKFELSGLRSEGIEVGSGTGTTKFDLTLGMAETAARFPGRGYYSAELFEARTIERMAQQFERLLEGMVANPERRVNEIAMVTAEEREELLVERNRTQTAYPAQASIQELFEEQVRKRPGALAVVC